MDGLKGFAEVAKNILYETFGLLIPGGLAALAIARVIDQRWLNTALAFTHGNPWLAIGGAYVLGYLVQALSRPINAIAESVLQLPARILALVGQLAPPLADQVREGTTWLDHALTGRHAHSRERDKPRVDVDEIIAIYWRRRLGLPARAALSEPQIRNLSFSQLIGERDGLDRFRAATSLTRAVATVAAVLLAIFLAQVMRGDRPVTWRLVGVIELLVVAFYGGLERADMYDDLWRTSLRAQFLCAVSRTQPLEAYRPSELQPELPRATGNDGDPVDARSGALAPPAETEVSDASSSAWREAEREGRGAEPPPKTHSAPSVVHASSLTTSTTTTVTAAPRQVSRAPHEDHHV